MRRRLLPTLARATWLGALAAVLAGCGSEAAGPAASGSSGGGGSAAHACAAGELGEPGACVPASLRPEAPCAPGEIAVADACVPAGVPASACGPGFVGDGAGCSVVGAPRCPDGEMALPGEAACRPVSDCPAGKWPPADAGSTRVHVDAAYAGPAPSDGSEAAPYTTIAAALLVAPDGAVVRVAAGTYAEDLEIRDPVTITGGCAARVTIVGSSTELAAVFVVDSTSVVLSDLAITGGSHAVVSEASETTLQRVYIHDAPGLGVVAQPNAGGGSKVTVRDSLLEDNGGAHVMVLGSEVQLETSLLRRGKSGWQGLGGAGLYAQNAPSFGLRSTASIRGSILEDVRDLGITAAGSDVTVHDSLVRGTRAGAMGLGRALHATAEPLSAERGTLLAERCVLEDGEESAVAIDAADAELRYLTIRGVSPSNYYARGVSIIGSPVVGRAVVTLESSLVEGAPEVGLLLTASDVTLRGVRVRDPGPADDPLWGYGIQVESDFATGEFGDVSLQGVAVERTRGTGIAVHAAAAEIEGTSVRDVAVPVGDAAFGVAVTGTEGRQASARLADLLLDGVGVGVFASLGTVTLEHALVRGVIRGLNAQGGAELEARGVRIEQAAGIGAYVSNGKLALEGCALVGTVPDAEGRFGDGLVALGGLADAVVSRTLVEGSARAALLAAGARVAFGDSAFLCSGFDLEAETVSGFEPRFEHLGGTVCGCGAEITECQVQSAGLDAAPALPDPSAQ